MNILFEYGECYLIKISHHLQVLLISHFKVVLSLSFTQLEDTLPTEMRNTSQLGKYCVVIVSTL